MEIKKRGRPAGSKNKNLINWEDLAKKIQEALNNEIKDHKETCAELDRYLGINHHVEYLEKEISKYKSIVLEQRGVIGYLEAKLKKLED
jgi:uncharacterized UPF0160 family protein